MNQIVINLEQGMPTVANARIRLDQGLRNARAQRVRIIKIIHGYGSSGKGGAIKKDVQSFLAEKKRSGQIFGFVAGEYFSPFDADARALLAQCPELAHDRDYSRGNDGITIMLL